MNRTPKSQKPEARIKSNKLIQGRDKLKLRIK